MVLDRQCCNWYCDFMSTILDSLMWLMCVDSQGSATECEMVSVETQTESRPRTRSTTFYVGDSSSDDAESDSDIDSTTTTKTTETQTEDSPTVEFQLPAEPRPPRPINECVAILKSAVWPCLNLSAFFRIPTGLFRSPELCFKFFEATTVCPGKPKTLFMVLKSFAKSLKVLEPEYNHAAVIWFTLRRSGLPIEFLRFSLVSWWLMIIIIIIITPTISNAP